MKKKIAQKSTLTPEQRMSDEHLFVAMYAERQAEDSIKNKAQIYDRNPDAKALYAKGVHDTLIFIKAMSAENVPAKEGIRIIGLLHDQSSADVDTHH